MALAAVLEATLTRVGMVSIQAIAVVVLILVVQRLFRRVLTPAWRYALWTVLVARLVLLWAPQAPWSVFNATRSLPAITFDQSGVEPVSMASLSDGPVLSIVSGTRARHGTFPQTSRADERPPHSGMAGGAESGSSIAAPGAPSTLVAEAAGLTLWLVLTAVWILGVAVSVSLFVVQCRRGRRLCRAAALAESEELTALIRRCCEAIGLPHAPRVRASAMIASPMVTGVWRPTLLLPAGFVEQATAEQLRLVFLHELMHVRRRDLWWDWLVYGLLAVHWFNPVLWWAAYRVAGDRELACDAAVLARLTPSERHAYGHALLDMFQRYREPTWAPGLAAIAEKRSLLERRIAMITGFRSMPRWAMAVGVLAVAGLAAVSLTNASISGQSKGDVTITQPDIWAAMGPNQQPQLIARVHNAGDAAVTATVRFVEVVSMGESKPVSDQPVDIPAKGEAFVKADWPAAYGIHSVRVELDPDSVLDETNKENNQASRMIAYAHGQFIYENMLTDDLRQFQGYEPDPAVLGTWKSVDFVGRPEDFQPGVKRFKGDLYLEGMVFFEQDGRGMVSMMKGATFPFTKGTIVHPGDQTASKYEIRSIDGQDYLFFEWKSGDVTIRHSAPQYYVLARTERAEAPDTQAAFKEHPGFPTLNQAEELYKAGKFDEAIPLYEAVYETYPTWNYAETGLMMIGIIKGRQGKIDEAVEWLEKATKEYGNIPGWSESTWYYLGEAYVQAKRPGDAKAAFRKAARMSEDRGATNHFAYQGSKARLEELNKS